MERFVPAHGFIDFTADSTAARVTDSQRLDLIALERFDLQHVRAKPNLDGTDLVLVPEQLRSERDAVLGDLDRSVGTPGRQEQRRRR